MKNHIYIPVFAVTLLTSAALLFSIQPLFSKMILPLLGGTPHVWNTAMLFFQVMLLAGYAYAHGASRYLDIRVQAGLQIALLILFVGVLPIAIPEGWYPPVDRDPTLWQLSVMAVAVGGPFFVLSGTAPLLQHWFSRSNHKDADNPYFLYGASNLGSMTSLLLYPVLAEPMMNLSEQSKFWAAGYIVLIALTAGAALLVWTHGTRKEKAAEKDDTKVTWAQRRLWLILAFAPSSLMLGVTTFITTDIASVPLLWILPLAIYVGTFIIVFARKPPFKREHIMLAQGVLLTLLVAKMVSGYGIHPGILIGLHMALFAASALACHTELAKARPSAAHLTEFYLIMSIGGAIGGFFNAIVVPNVFILPLEYVVVLVLATALRYSTDEDKSVAKLISSIREEIKKKGFDAFFTFPVFALLFVIITGLYAAYVPQKAAHYVAAVLICSFLLLTLRRRWLFAGATCLALLIYPPGYNWGRQIFTNIIHQDRNFFGVIKVVETTEGERVLLHGTTNHGAQALDVRYKMEPLSYYSRFSPVNDAFRFLDRRGGRQSVAVIGLGVGVTACFDNPGRNFVFYEIDPEITAIAQDPKLFTFLSDCGSPNEVILGDGRLKIAEAKDRSYDMILLDAFSSDNIPVHLLTKEAIELYLSKLKKDGILVFNISNNYLDIEPVLAQVGKALKVPAYARYTKSKDIEGTKLRGYAAHFFIMSPEKNNIPFFKDRGWTDARFREGVKLWTDQFSNIVSVLGNKTGFGRHLEIVEKEKKEKAAEEVTSSP